jgi:excisionase family DNA binding protein
MPDTLHASTVPAGELEQVTDFVATLPQGSAVAVLLQHLVVSMRKGKDVAFVETEKHLSPNQAAELLQMSRPHLLKLMRAGELSTDMVGSHHKIPMSELLDFIDRRERAKAAVAAAYAAPDVVEDALRSAAGDLSDEDIESLNSL